MSTSKLQRYTSKYLHRQFGKYGLVENVYPTWLTSSKGEHLELDFFIDRLSTAVEVQGRQHLEFTPFFHATEYDFSEQLRRDAEKKALCDKAGIYLFYVYNKPDVEVVLYKIHAQIQGQLNAQTDAWPDNDSEKLRAIFRKTKTLTPQETGKRVRRFNARIDSLVYFLKAENPDEILCKGVKTIIRKINRNTKRGIIVPSEAQLRVVIEARVKLAQLFPETFLRPLHPLRSLGNRRMRQRGNKLTAIQIRKSQYCVWGGESSHIVSFDDHAKIDSYLCDCSGYHKAKDGVCTHVWAVLQAINSTA